MLKPDREILHREGNQVCEAATPEAGVAGLLGFGLGRSVTRERSSPCSTVVSTHAGSYSQRHRSPVR